MQNGQRPKRPLTPIIVNISVYLELETISMRFENFTK